MYAAALQAKLEANSIREDNNKLQSRIAYLEHKFGQNDTSGHVSMLQKQLKEQKAKCIALQTELNQQNLLIKHTCLIETRTENELYKSELIRLRILLEKELN